MIKEQQTVAHKLWVCLSLLLKLSKVTGCFFCLFQKVTWAFFLPFSACAHTFPQSQLYRTLMQSWDTAWGSTQSRQTGLWLPFWHAVCCAVAVCPDLEEAIWSGYSIALSWPSSWTQIFICFYLGHPLQHHTGNSKSIHWFYKFYEWDSIILALI